MSSSGSDSSQKAQEAQYRANAEASRVQGKRSIEEMFEGVADFSSQTTSGLSTAVAQLGKYGYIDKNKLQTSGATKNYGIKNMTTDPYEAMDFDQAAYERFKAERDERIDDQGRGGLSYGIWERKKGSDGRENKEVWEEYEAKLQVIEEIKRSGGMEALGGVATNVAAQRLMGSSLDAVMKAKAGMVRDRSKLINGAIKSSSDAFVAGKHFQTSANYANQAARYAREQSAWNNFFQVASFGLSIATL